MKGVRQGTHNLLIVSLAYVTMKLIIYLIVCALVFFVPYLRIVFFNIFEFLTLTLKDIFLFFRNLSFHTCPCGIIRCFSGLFGQGKTLSAVHYISDLYKRYNNKLVFYKGKFRRNKIIILSNVEFKTIPFIPLTSLKQIVTCCQQLETFEQGNYCVTYLVLIDEASSQLNSRDFKSNIEPMLLNSLLTSRHYRMSIFYTSQRFLLVDKLLREVTESVVECKKIGRVQLWSIYNAFDLENSSNITLVKPRNKTGFLVRDRDYDNYDTLACVNNLSKSMLTEDMLTSAEILQSIEYQDNLDNVNLSRRGKLRFHRRNNRR